MLDLLWHIRGVPYTSMSESQKLLYMRRILGGDFGWDLKFAFNPIKVRSADASLVSEDDLNHCRTSLNLFTWAWNMLRSHQAHSMLPPAEVFDGTNLWARHPDP